MSLHYILSPHYICGETICSLALVYMTCALSENVEVSESPWECLPPPSFPTEQIQKLYGLHIR